MEVESSLARRTRFLGIEVDIYVFFNLPRIDTCEQQ